MFYITLVLDIFKRTLWRYRGEFGSVNMHVFQEDKAIVREPEICLQITKIYHVSKVAFLPLCCASQC